MQLVRRILAWFAPTRAYAVTYALVAVAGAVSCFVPLFDLIGYESAALFGVLGGLAATGLTLHAVQRGLLEAPLATTRVTSPTAAFCRLWVRHLGLLVVPLVFLGINALRVQNCAVGVGFALWLAIPVGSILCGQLIAWTALALFPGQPRGRLLFCVAIIGASIAAPVAHLALEPPIVGHHIFLGYFSGSIYDEALAMPSSLPWYRLMHLAAAVLVLALIEAVWRARDGRRWHWMMLVVLAAAIGFTSIWWHRKDLGVGIDRGYIEQELDGRIETEHFVIHHPRNEWFLRRRDALAEDHEYRYAELAAFFETDPAAGRKIHSYVYPNREEKGRLMGARDTLVAKLWLHEMHIGWGGLGEHTLAHELAHIFTEPFGAGPLKLSTQSYVGVNMGLVEGVATAADWPTEELTPHQASAALRRLKLAPDISEIVGASGFWTQSSGRAYTLVGSFVRYLIDTYGIEPFKAAYPTGDFAGAYDKSADELVEEWRAMLDELDLSDRERDLARYLYDRPSIFDKVCARQLGELERKARAAADRGRLGEMQQLYETILEYAPERLEHRVSYARAYSRAGEHQRALEMVEALLDERSDTSPVWRARLRQLHGDLAWRLDRVDEAKSSYRSCADHGVTTDIHRLLEVKLEALERPADEGRSDAFEYLLGRQPDAVKLYYPMRWHRRSSEDPVAAYLIGRRLWNERQWRRATPFLEQAAEELQPAILLDETARMLGVARYFQGELSRAERALDRLDDSEHPYYREQAREWRNRIAWKGGNRIRTQ